MDKELSLRIWNNVLYLLGGIFFFLIWRADVILYNEFPLISFSIMFGLEFTLICLWVAFSEGKRQGF